MRASAIRRRPFFALREATFRLGERLVFEKTSWTFQRNEHWAVIGPNGSGKSWLVEALRGRLPLVEGELRYGFRPPLGLSPEQVMGHIGFEDRKLDVHEMVVQSRWNSIEEDGALLVKDFLSYERVMEINPFEVVAGREEAEGRFARRRSRAVRLLDISPFWNRTLFSLSNGERQRVQWAAALCHPLRLLILDEPFTGLDSEVREHFHAILKQLMRSPLRVLFVTTRAEDLPRGITHVLQLQKFRVVGSWQTKFQVPSPKAAARSPQSTVHGPKFTGRGPQSQVPGSKAQVRGPSRTLSWGASELIVMRDVRVQYGTRTILDGINWTIRRGESWALLGPNGAGKTTLLSLILGDNPQVYRNDIVLFGRQRGQGESIWDLKRYIGWVSPELHLHFNEAVSCLEVVESGFHETVGLFEAQTKRHRLAARDRLRQFGLLAFAPEPLLALSLGQQRMVLLARALVKKPRLLILDEPCQGLDEGHRRLFIGTLDQMLSEGSVTAIYVTHRLEELPHSICRVLRLNGGRAQITAA